MCSTASERASSAPSFVSTMMLSGKPARRSAAPAPRKWVLQRRKPEEAPRPISPQHEFHRAVAQAAVPVVKEHLGSGSVLRHSDKRIARQCFPAVPPGARQSAAGNCFWTDFREVSKLIAKKNSRGRLAPAVKCNTILDAIGHTPLIRLHRIAKDVPPEVFVKADYLNPGGSMKDRIAGSHDRRSRAQGPAQAGRHDHRRHLGQHRHGPRARGGRARIQNRLHHHGQAVARKNRSAESIRRGSDRLPHGR